MKNVFLILFVALALGIIGMPVAAQVTPQPLRSKLVEFTVPSTPLANPTGTITVAIGTPTIPTNPIGNLVGCTTAFAPVALSCGSVGNAGQMAAAVASGINANGNAAGYSASLSGSNQVFIFGPPTPGQDTFFLCIFSAEINSTLGLVLNPAYPVANLCDGIPGNEEQASTGNGVVISAVTVLDPTVGNFEITTTGIALPPNWGWSAAGQVSVEPGGYLSGPASGFPTSGSKFLRMGTNPVLPGGTNKLATAYLLDLANPTFILDYRWFHSGGPSLNWNNTFRILIARVPSGGFYPYYIEVAREDTFTPATAGIRTIEVDLTELYALSYPPLQQGDAIELGFILDDYGFSAGGPSVVFVDNIRFGPKPSGEGNSAFVGGMTFTNAFRIETSTWDPIHWASMTSAADKKAPLGGFVSVSFIYSGSFPTGGLPFVLMGELKIYGTQPLISLPGEPNVIGLGSGMAPLFIGTWAPGFPALSFQVPSAMPALDGLGLQAAILDPTAQNFARISNLQELRFE